MSRLHLLVVVLVITLAASLFSNFILYDYAKKTYLSLQHTRLNPLGLARTGVDTAARNPNETHVLLFGDSGIVRWPLPEMASFRFYKAGVGGQTTAQALGRFEKEIDPADYDVIVVQLGINDLKTIPLFPDRYAQIVNACKANLTALIDDASKNGAIVVILPLFPTGEPFLVRKPFWSDDVQKARNEVNTYLKSLAHGNLIVLDVFEDPAPKHADINADLLHLNREGYNILNRRFKSLLENYHGTRKH